MERGNIVSAQRNAEKANDVRNKMLVKKRKLCYADSTKGSTGKMSRASREGGVAR